MTKRPKRKPLTSLSPTELRAISREIGGRAMTEAPDLIEIEIPIAEVMLTCASHVTSSPGRYDGSPIDVPKGLDDSARRLGDALRQNVSRTTFGGGSSAIGVFPRDAKRLSLAVALVAEEENPVTVPMPKEDILRYSLSLRTAAVMENTRGGMVGLDVTLIHLIRVCVQTVLADPEHYVVAFDDGVTVTEKEIEIIEDCHSEIDALGGGGAGGIHVSPMSAAAFSLALRLVAEFGS